MRPGRYIPYSPRTKKALEAIGDIKQLLRRRKGDKHIYGNMGMRTSGKIPPGTASST